MRLARRLSFSKSKTPRKRASSPRSPRKSSPRTPATRSPRVSSGGVGPRLRSMVDTPSTASDDDTEAFHWRPASPATAVVDGKRLSDFAGLIFDVCGLTAALTGGRIGKKDLQTFRALLDAEGVAHYPYTDDPVLSKTSVRIASPMDMHRLLCKLPGRLQTVARA